LAQGPAQIEILGLLNTGILDHPSGFLTTENPGSGLFKDKGSKFLGFALALENPEALKPILEQLKKEHPQARHFCYAWRMNNKDGRYRANDDGEPANSAGMPILHQIQSRDLFETAVIVVRYFGGTKLGVPGLINAYKEAAKLALDAATTTFKVYTKTCFLSCNYPQVSAVMHAIRKHAGQITHQEMGLQATFEVRIPELQRAQFQLDLPRDVRIFEEPQNA
jgi:uncharacterized YigZ family protein